MPSFAAWLTVLIKLYGERKGKAMLFKCRVLQLVSALMLLSWEWGKWF